MWCFPAAPTLAPVPNLPKSRAQSSVTYDVSMPVRLPRVEAILGAPIDQLAIQHIEAAVEAGVEESRDLDFKEDHYSDNEELAKDVAAFANHVGGLIVVGV